jgi:hypothetical protein
MKAVSLADSDTQVRSWRELLNFLTIESSYPFGILPLIGAGAQADLGRLGLRYGQVIRWV